MIPRFPNFHPPGCYWHSWTELLGASDNGLCEAVTCGLIAKPLNTWSNLAYFAVALYLLQRDRSFSIFIFFLGAASFFLHASGLYPALLLDLGTSFALIGWAYSKTLRVKNFVPFVLGFGIFAITASHLLLSFGSHFRYLYPLGVVGVGILEFRRPREENRNLWVALALVLLGFGFASLDGNPQFCRPQHWLQGHAIWHVLTALAIPYLERHYRDLKNSEKST